MENQQYQHFEQHRFSDRKAFKKFLEKIKDPNCSITNLDVSHLKIGTETPNEPSEQDTLNLLEAIKVNNSLKRVDMSYIDHTLKTLNALKGIFVDEQGNWPNKTLQLIIFEKVPNDKIVKKTDQEKFNNLVREIDRNFNPRWPEPVLAEQLVARGLLDPKMEEEFNKFESSTKADIKPSSFTPQFKLEEAQNKEAPDESLKEKPAEKPNDTPKEKP